MLVIWKTLIQQFVRRFIESLELVSNKGSLRRVELSKLLAIAPQRARWYLSRTAVEQTSTNATTE
jgi:hypothetical protein